MPYEVHPVRGPSVNRGDPANSIHNRSAEKVAEDIARVYQNVSERGGQIVAGHTLQYVTVGMGRSEQLGENALFLVAEIPESPDGPQ